MTADRNARIQERAYHLWLEEGQPHGRHDEHWHRAERELIEEESRLREAPPARASRDAAEANGAPEASAGKAAPSRARNRQEPAAAEPDGISRSRAKSQQARVHSKADHPKARPQSSRSRPAAAGSSESRSNRRSAAKPAG
jgi:DUF2934 family protein